MKYQYTHKMINLSHYRSRLGGFSVMQKDVMYWCNVIISLPPFVVWTTMRVSRVATCVLAASRLKVLTSFPACFQAEFQWEQLYQFMWENRRTNRNLPCSWTKTPRDSNTGCTLLSWWNYLRFSLNQRVFGFTWQQMRKEASLYQCFFIVLETPITYRVMA